MSKKEKKKNQVCTKHFKKQNETVKTNKWYFHNPTPSLPSKCPFQSRVTVCTVTSRTKYFSLWATSIQATVWGAMVPVSPAKEAVNTVFTQILKAYAGQGRINSEESGCTEYHKGAASSSLSDVWDLAEPQHHDLCLDSQQRGSRGRTPWSLQDLYLQDLYALSVRAKIEKNCKISTTDLTKLQPPKRIGRKAESLGPASATQWDPVSLKQRPKMQHGQGFGLIFSTAEN